MEEMLEKIDTLNLRDLRIVNKYIVERIKLEHTQNNKRNALLLEKGDKVYFVDKDRYKHNCVIEKINRTTINVKCECERCNLNMLSNNSWKVSASMLKKREE